MKPLKCEVIDDEVHIILVSEEGYRFSFIVKVEEFIEYNSINMTSRKNMYPLFDTVLFQK